jgi:hypothetical protein
MKLLEILLIEGREDDFRNRVDKLLTPDDINYIIDEDPSTSKKYLKWISQRLNDIYDDKGFDYFHKNFWRGSKKNELMDNIREFDSRVKGIDIFKVKTIDDLSDILKNRTVSKKEQLSGDIDVIADTDDWLVIAPESHEAAKHYGGSTKWCISTSNETYWDSYYDEKANTIVIVKNRNLDKINPLWKIALVGKTNDIEAYDANDTELGQSGATEFLSTLPEKISSGIINYFDSEKNNRIKRKGGHKQKKFISGANIYFGEGEFRKELRKFLSGIFNIVNSKFDVSKNLDISGIIMGAIGFDKLKNICYNLCMSQGNRMKFELPFSRIYHINSQFDTDKEFTEFLRNSLEQKDFEKFNRSIKYINYFSDFYESMIDTLTNILTKEQIKEFYSMVHFETDFEAYVFGADLSVGFDQDETKTFDLPPKINSTEDIVKFYQKLGYQEVIDLFNAIRINEIQYKDFYRELLMCEGINKLFTKQSGNYLIVLENGGRLISHGESPTNAIFSMYINKYYKDRKRYDITIKELYLIKNKRGKEQEYIKIQQENYLLPTEADYILYDFLVMVNIHQGNHTQDRIGLLNAWSKLDDRYKEMFKYTSNRLLYRGDEVYPDNIDNSDEEYLKYFLSALSFSKSPTMRLFGLVGYTTLALKSFDGSIDIEKVEKYLSTQEFNHKFGFDVALDIPDMIGSDEGEVILLNVKPKYPTPEAAKIKNWRNT